MRKFVLFFSLIVAVAAGAQTLTKRKTMCNYALGNIKLEQIVQKTDTTYALLITTGNRFHKYVVVSLGSRENAIRLLKVVEETKLKNDDILSLENEMDNVVTRGSFGAIRFYSEGRQFSGDIGKNYIRSLIRYLSGEKQEKEQPAESEEPERDVD